MALTKVSFSLITGASFNVLDYGADPTGVANSTDAFIAAANAITAADGGTLVIPNGTYLVGKQTFAGQTGLGYAYNGVIVIPITNCTHPVVIEGNGAILKVASGLKYGAFDPVTGAALVTTIPYLVNDSKAYVNDIIQILSCSSVIIRNLEIDGSVDDLVVGGQWGGSGSGIQLAARGIYIGECDNVCIENVYSHHNGLDGFEVKHTVTNTTDLSYPHTLKNCRSTYNGRQGLSWTGGNNLTCDSCDFSFTGKNTQVTTAPGAGVDIEPESSLGRNGTFINCRFFNNNGPGVLADTGDSADCTFIGCRILGSTFNSIYGTKPRFKFTNCLINGAVTNLWGVVASPEDSTQFYGCTFYMTPSTPISINGLVYGTRHNFDSSEGCLFDACSFYSSSGYTLPFSVGGNDGTRYVNCNFEQTSVGTFFTRGVFFGFNKFTYPTGTYDNTGTVVYGMVFLNGVQYRYVTSPSFTNVQIFDESVNAAQQRIAYHSNPVTWANANGGGLRGDIVFYPNPSAGGKVGAVCVASGTPGTWKNFGAIDP